MPLRIIEVHPRSLAQKAGITAGDTITKINGMDINDFFDLEYYANDYQLDFLLLDDSGNTRELTVFRQANKPLGIEPEQYRHKHCFNNCVFCFIDQMPKGMRPSLYNKDDDYLYSYVFGNYITLNNLNEEELERIIGQHISPLYISVHSTNTKLRKEMMRYGSEFEILPLLRMLADEGISYHLQIVCVPGYNCGDELRKTLSDLLDPDLSTLSLGVVPVGLTDHRQKLTRLDFFTPQLAQNTISMIEEYRASTDIVYAADELYVLAGMPIPEMDYYNDFPQLENGIGMLRLTQSNFQKKKRAFIKEMERAAGQFLILTSKSASGLIQEIAAELNGKLTRSRVRIQILRNDFFGSQISVSGLLTASDICGQISPDPGECVILPSNVFNPEGLTLDDVSQIDLRLKLQRPILLVDQLFEDWEWL